MRLVSRDVVTRGTQMNNSVTGYPYRGMTLAS